MRMMGELAPLLVRSTLAGVSTLCIAQLSYMHCSDKIAPRLVVRNSRAIMGFSQNGGGETSIFCRLRRL